jgi:hypothetical protein
MIGKDILMAGRAGLCEEAWNERGRATEPIAWLERTKTTAEICACPMQDKVSGFSSRLTLGNEDS